MAMSGLWKIIFSFFLLTLTASSQHNSQALDWNREIRVMLRNQSDQSSKQIVRKFLRYLNNNNLPDEQRNKIYE